MGLDTTHDAWHGAYSAFARWRAEIERVSGVRVEWDDITDANINGDWESDPHDPLVVLIAHSDCDGHIEPRHAGPLADRLEGLLPLLPQGDGGGHIWDWRAKTSQFIAGLRDAAEHGERVEFR